MTRASGLAVCLRRVLVTDRVLLPEEDPVGAIAALAARHRATAVMLREKDLPARRLVELARGLVDRVPALIVAHRPEVARETGAAGVHLGWTSPSSPAARAVLHPDAWIGVSVHSVEEGVRRVAERPDYLVLGPIRATPSKAGRIEPLGFEALERLSRSVDVPVVGIGGLGLDDEQRVLATGASGLAAIRAFLVREAT